MSCYTKEQREILGIEDGVGEFEPVFPDFTRISFEVGGRIVGAGIGLYIVNLFPDQRENTGRTVLSVLAGYMLLNVVTHCLTDKIWGREEYIPWYKRLMQW
ncbi:hypothetical protein HYU96_02175 [Candidatus Daviesbacteria bacterium]|nr:hypothetical protein [Candidatus Daviesbacteria bacterium]